jgi:hypothetical protein
MSSSVAALIHADAAGAVAQNQRQKITQGLRVTRSKKKHGNHMC